MSYPIRPILTLQSNVKVLYNESNEVATAASEVKDYLPEGLVFKAVYNKDGSALNSADYTYSAKIEFLKPLF